MHILFAVITLDDFENGITSYQSTLQIDARHYNSWYGLGMIYLRQEKFECSEHHFRMAFQINPQSSVIMPYLGTALHALQNSGDALELMEKAILADKKNPLPVFLEVLEDLKESSPRERSVYALMGRIYKRRNMHKKAMPHFGLALNLEPSAIDVATIKIKEDLPSLQRVAAGWQHDVTSRSCNLRKDASMKGCLTGHQSFNIFFIIDIKRSNNRLILVQFNL